jgi:hypothetical protein
MALYSRGDSYKEGSIRQQKAAEQCLYCPRQLNSAVLPKAAEQCLFCRRQHKAAEGSTTVPILQKRFGAMISKSATGNNAATV